jgi:hypothetical protein
MIHNLRKKAIKIVNKQKTVRMNLSLTVFQIKVF